MSYDFYIDIDSFEKILLSSGINIPEFWMLPEKYRIQIMEQYSKINNVNKFLLWLSDQDYFTKILE